MTRTITHIEFVAALRSENEATRLAATYGQLERHLAEHEAMDRDAKDRGEMEVHVSVVRR